MVEGASETAILVHDMTDTESIVSQQGMTASEIEFIYTYMLPTRKPVLYKSQDELNDILNSEIADNRIELEDDEIETQ